jgi:hypothetical protein
MCAVRDSFRDALLQAGGQNSFMRIKWYLFSIGAFFSYGRLLCWEAVSSGEVSKILRILSRTYMQICLHSVDFMYIDVLAVLIISR